MVRGLLHYQSLKWAAYSNRYLQELNLRVDFEFRLPEESPETPHRGRGWLTDRRDGLDLILRGGGFGRLAYPES